MNIVKLLKYRNYKPYNSFSLNVFFLLLINLLSLIFPTPALASAARQETYELKGYLKSYLLWNDAYPKEELTSLFGDRNWQSQNAARLMLDYFPDTHQAFEINAQVHYELLGIYQSDSANILNSPLSTLTPTTYRYRATDIDPVLSDGKDDGILYQNLDRLNVQFSFDKTDIVVGRQAVALGAARTINPTDIFVPYTITTLNQEYRQGIDAIRYQLALGQLSELDLGYIAGEGFEENAAWGQLLLPIRFADVTWLLANADEDWLYGAGLQSSIGESGFWLEVARMEAEALDYHRLTVGLDRSINEDVFAQIEFHYNGAGTKETANYFSQINSAPWQKHGVYLLGKKYLMPSIAWQASALVNLSSQLIYNIHDQSFLLSNHIEYGVSENFYSDIGLNIFHGAAGDFVPPITYLPESEFGNSVDSLYFSIRYYL